MNSCHLIVPCFQVLISAVLPICFHVLAATDILLIPISDSWWVKFIFWDNAQKHLNHLLFRCNSESETCFSISYVVVYKPSSCRVQPVDFGVWILTPFKKLLVFSATGHRKWRIVNIFKNYLCRVWPPTSGLRKTIINLALSSSKCGNIEWAEYILAPLQNNGA